MSGLKLFNTLTGQLEAFEPADAAVAVQESRAARVNMYVCGPTVYDDAHLGHARCYITWDVLYRFLRCLGYDVTYVRNVTDVDDKILNRAKERNEAPAALAARNYDSFQADMKALNVLPPSQEPRATEYIPEMLAGIQALIAKEAAYATLNGSVYFRVSAKPNYGQLKYATQDVDALKKHLADLQAGARVEVDEDKESSLDFALWKAVPLSDPNAWESPWPATGQKKGWGRPGWHMECSAMNHAVFGEQIDIHAGGADLIFPHHENEIAQSEAWSGKAPFSKYWLHNGFVNVSGEKMSKSLGNFSTIKTLLQRYDANTIRYFLLTNHYRMPVDFNEEALQAAENRMVKIRRALNEAKARLGILPKPDVLGVTLQFNDEDVQGTWCYFQDAMLNDLNTAKALSAFDETISSLGIALEARGQEFFQLAICIAAYLGFNVELFFAQDKQLPQAEILNIYQRALQGQPETEVLPDVTAPDSASPEALLSGILAMRKQAKQTKNWSQADAIRKQLTDIGLQILDNRDGTTTLEKDGLEILRV
jgi:cysteinyl-tRNA synthetase